MTETDVLIVGAGPTGLMLARELGLLGVNSTVLDRLPRIWEVARAGGLGGQILDVLAHRGLLARFEEESGLPRPTPRFPFGGLHVDLTRLERSPMQALLLPQPRLEALLGDLAVELGADVRRGHEVTGLSQHDDAVDAEVVGPAGPYRVSAQYLVGCDGVRSRIRDLAGIPYPGVTYPEVNRLGSFTMPASVTRLQDGSFAVPGLGTLPFGYTQTGNGVFAISSYDHTELGLYTSEEETETYDDHEPMTVAEFAASIRRVLGADVPLGEPRRMTRFTYGARHAERYRQGRVLLAGDAAHRFPSGGVGVTAGMLDAVNLAWKLAATVGGWAPAGLLDTYHAERHLAGTRTLMHTQAQVAIRRGHDEAAVALRELLAELLLDDQPLRRVGALIAGADARLPMPGWDRHDLVGGFTSEPHADGPTARPVVLDLAGRPEVHVAAADWARRVDVHAAAGRPVEGRTSDALLIRPDGYVAWAAPVGESADGATATLREALRYWFGEPDEFSRDEWSDSRTHPHPEEDA